MEAVDWNEEVYLLGVPTLSDYVEYVRNKTLGGADAKESGLIAEWMAADALFARERESEPDIADGCEVRELPASMRPLVGHVLDDPYFTRAFENLPVAFGMVELDRLVVFQKDITRDHGLRLQRGLGQTPSDQDLFELCLPYRRQMPIVHMARAGRRKFVFHSQSTDLRFLGARLVPDAELPGTAPIGPLAGTLALMVGMGPNYMNVVRNGNRMVLNEGYHRAYALRAMGITHAPCVIQSISHQAEMAFAGGGELVRGSDRLFHEPRPPILRDFFDPRKTKVLRTPKLRRQIQISFEVETLTVPGC